MGAIIAQSQIPSFDPQFWTRHIVLKDQTRVFIRPIASDDESLFREFLDHITPEDLRKRFFGPVKEFSPAFVSALVDIDYSTAFAALALDESNGLMLGGVRLMLSKDQQAGEYAIMLRSDFKGRGLGWQLMRLIIDYAKDKGLKRIEGRVLAQNLASSWIRKIPAFAWSALSFSICQLCNRIMPGGGLCEDELNAQRKACTAGSLSLP